MTLRQFHKNKVANAIGAVGALGGSAALIYKLVQRVRTGHGLDHYIAMSGQEWSPLAALVCMGVAATALVIAGLLRWMPESAFLGTLRNPPTGHARPRAGKRAK